MDAASKPAWLFRQSAVIPFIRDSGALQIVLITSRSAKKWGIPKGIIERGMSPQASAAKEALEEAGVIGHVSDRLLAEYESEKWGGTCHVQVFALEVTEIMDSWDEMSQRERAIVDAARAIELVKPVLRNILIKFHQLYAA